MAPSCPLVLPATLGEELYVSPFRLRLGLVAERLRAKHSLDLKRCPPHPPEGNEDTDIVVALIRGPPKLVVFIWGFL